MKPPRPSGPRPVTAAYLDRAAVHYLERYASTAENLRHVLARKVRKRLGPDGEPPPDLDRWLAETVERAVRSGLVDDARFAEMKVSSLSRRGASPRAIGGRLRQKGVPAELAKAALAEAGLDELALARRFVERKRLGSYRLRPDQALRERDLAALGRAGFSYRIAVQALDTTATGEDAER